ncbi:hypothetical protein SNOG_05670 [Parastagonospora nodorum SN15]|uniref:Uncharacterized protein n=1 Tax=Phaeosphaeria nodorum (strain SN15 / ATCC MYA-4574 / FGSC 10173) TaxID=321614 RepID=Q0URE4_PHANO|nr:hypothetical protein SNOG_05670 [Parastagonospora nodorum SN15]EAT86734.1 hypothetical protein SNOG_05670 [Parastagonospora nodorum SN15]
MAGCLFGKVRSLTLKSTYGRICNDSTVSRQLPFFIGC